MNYENYKASRNLAWEILLNEGINELPINVSALCRSIGIPIKYYDPPDDNDGKCEMVGSRPVIYIKKDCYRPRQRFTAAHELGHILLGHVGKYKLVNREPSKNDNPIEQAANVFASRLLAPACVLWGCNVKTAADIMRLCDISHQSAEYRMIRMEELYSRNKFLLSPLERAVYEQFQDYIKANRL